MSAAEEEDAALGTDLEPGALLEVRRRLTEALEERRDRDSRLVEIYTAGLALLESDLPDRPALISHEFRELIEKLSRALEVPRSHQTGLRVRVRELEESLKEVIDASTCHREGEWSGQVDEPLAAFLGELRDWFNQLKLDLRSRQDVARGLLHATDSSGSPMPQVIEDRQLTAWRELERFFEGAAHHGIYPSLEEVVEKVVQLEVFLVSRLRPTAVQEYGEIDRLIARAEGRDDA